MSVSATAIAVTDEVPAQSRAGIGLWHFLLICAQLALVLLLFRQFQLESAAFLRLSLLVFAGFAIHAFLPLAWRIPFFALLSLASIGLVLGVVNGAWLVGIGLVLIGVCHLPLSFRLRIGLLVAIVALLVAQRGALAPFPWSEAIWPILGSMFMFRLIVYLYDLRHEKTSGSWAQRLAYFFMVPNACFPLFPVVDYKTFRSNYYDDDAYRIYQLGVDWMVRGAIHLILYRVVYYHLTLAPSEVTGPAQLSQYLVANFLLYLRVSGLFHLVVGMLHLFGFRLPETHNRYLLASSFTDFWRRINIYWKDFMQKVFYFPAVFALRRFGTTKALVVATLFVFLMTWFLHAWQWFWLRGTVLFVWQDILFWAILGALVVVNSLYEIRHGRKRSLRPQARTGRDTLVVVAKTFATFWFIVVLWSFWTAESLMGWFSMWQALAGDYTLEFLFWPALSLLVIALGTVQQGGVRNLRGSEVPASAWMRERAVTIGAAFALVVVSVEGVSTSVSPQVATFVHSLRSGQLSRIDTAKLERGYYESLLDVNRFNSQLWEVYGKKPANWLDVQSTNLKRFVPGFQRNELIPSFVRTTAYGSVTINRFGMRDRDYAERPAPGTYRAVLLGASSVMGWGVSDGQTFEALVEQRLNEQAAGGDIERFELLNMGVPGYDPPQQIARVDRALEFGPHAVYFVATGREISRSVRNLVAATRDQLEIPHPELRAYVEKAGVGADMDEAAALRRLAPHGPQLLATVYGAIARKTREAGAVPVWIFLPQVRSGAWEEETADTLRIARDAGFVVIDMADVYRSHDYTALRVGEWDDHPNVRGHQVIADRLYAELTSRRAELFDSARTR